MNEIQEQISNLHRSGVPPDVIVELMSRSGVSAEEIAQHFSSLESPAAAEPVHQTNAKTKAFWMAGVFRSLQRYRRSVPIVNDLSYKEFRDRYYSENRPVLTNIRYRNDNCPDWSFELLRERYGDTPIEIMRGRSRDPFHELRPDDHREQIPLGVFIDEIRSVVTNDVYLTADNNILQTSLKRILRDLDVFPSILDRRYAKDNAYLWIGPKGATSQAHHDTSNVLLVQLIGTKKIILIPPYETCFVYDNGSLTSPIDFEEADLLKFPLFRHTRPFHVTLHPGHALFIPVGWWHQVYSMTPSMSASMMNFAFPNYFPPTGFKG